MKKLVREPLVHFLLIGAALFAAWHYLKPPLDASPASKEIRLSLEEISRLAMLSQAQWNREPTAEELGRLVEDRVKEEVLYREAVALGLDKGDMIIKRRLAQKMQFLAEDIATAHEPSADELRDWYAQNGAQFAMPARFSFRHLYFSPDRRGSNAHDDAVRALAKLTGQPEDSKLAGALADPFMFQDYYRERSTEFLGKEFGPGFAQAVGTLDTGSWRGPIESGFGWHLVYVDAVIPGRVPDLEEVAPDAKNAWLAAQKALGWEKTYKDIRAKYTVLLPAPPDDQAPAVGAVAKPVPPKPATGLDDVAPL